MDIANITPINPTSTPNPSQLANTEGSAKVAPEQKPSTVVNISEEAKKLNETTKNAAPTNAPENKAPQSREAAEAPGIQFMAGESKKGRVSTYA